MKIIIPKVCPSCNYPIQLRNDQVFCVNPSCTARLNKKLEHFAKTLGIKGFGPKTIEKLNLLDLTELFYLDREELISILGSEKVVDKLLNEVERAKSAPLATILAAFGIELIGGTASAKIAGVVRSIDEINPETCKEAGLGDKATANLINWLQTEYKELEEFLPFNFNTQISLPENTNAEVVCITGRLKSFKTKAEATTTLINLGFRVSESVTKTTNYLVDEENKNSSKRKKAEEYGIPIISNLLDFINKVKND